MACSSGIGRRVLGSASTTKGPPLPFVPKQSTIVSQVPLGGAYVYQGNISRHFLSLQLLGLLRPSDVLQKCLGGLVACRPMCTPRGLLAGWQSTP